MANRTHARCAFIRRPLQVPVPEVQCYPSPLPLLHSFLCVLCGAVCGGNTIAMSAVGIYALGVAE